MPAGKQGASPTRPVAVGTRTGWSPHGPTRRGPSGECWTRGPLQTGRHGDSIPRGRSRPLSSETGAEIARLQVHYKPVAIPPGSAVTHGDHKL
jgi:hypothetical protein